jgi:hypothetical protein
VAGRALPEETIIQRTERVSMKCFKPIFHTKDRERIVVVNKC